jgi:hypothetical protein
MRFLTGRRATRGGAAADSYTGPVIDESVRKFCASALRLFDGVRGWFLRVIFAL